MNKDTELGSGRTVGVVLDAAELEDEAKAFAEDASSLEEMVGALMEADLMSDAVKLLAHALPDREAVGWAWVCARESTGEDAPEAAEEALDATRAWIKDPNDEARRTAMELAEVAGFGTPAGFVGLAAFCCGDSMAPPELDDVPPPEGLVGTLVASCIAMAAAEGEPAGGAERLAGFASRGMELANRIELWPEEPDEATTQEG